MSRLQKNLLVHVLLISEYLFSETYSVTVVVVGLKLKILILQCTYISNKSNISDVSI